MPFPAPGSRQAATTMTSKRTKSVGMSSLEALSMPPRTPWIITKWVMKRMATVQKTGLTASLENSLKYRVTKSGSPCNSPTTEA